MDITGLLLSRLQLAFVGHDVPEERPSRIMDGRTDEVIDLTRSHLWR